MDRRWTVVLTVVLVVFVAAWARAIDFPTMDPAPTLCNFQATNCPFINTLCNTQNTLCPPIETECPVIVTECPVIGTECPVTGTACPLIETECPVWSCGPVPAVINYQGRLFDAAGAPVSGTETMRFEFYNADTGGVRVNDFSEEQSVAVTEGIFNVLVGSATVGGVPENTFNPTDVFLSVQVAGEELLPRRPVAAVPYAIRASGSDNADSLDGQDSSAFAQSSDLAAALDRIAALETLLTLFAGVTRDGNNITFSGVNLHIVNGTGRTGGAVNGVGNLIVGYNEGRFGGGDNRSGSHNIVVGKEHNFSSYGGLVAGEWNTVSGRYSSVSGGYRNTASGWDSSVSGGSRNTASGQYSSVSGGSRNTASGWDSSVSGGRWNGASGQDSSVSGGLWNVASDDHSSVSGGQWNVASGRSTSVSGGSNNTASGSDSSVSGGWSNEASGQYSSVSGGARRSVNGEDDWRAGSLFQDN